MSRMIFQRRFNCAGFTLVEVAISLAVIAIALLGMISAIVAAQKTNEASRELTVAMNAAREKVEEMRSYPLSEVYARYNADPNDNPATGESPGPTFPVSGLVPPSNTLNGKIVFPEDSSGSGSTSLREYVDDPRLGMPRDLNGDGIVDTGNHSSDYVILPMRIVIEWRGIYGAQRFEMNTCLYEK